MPKCKGHGFNSDGSVIPTGTEATTAARNDAKKARSKAQEAKLRAEKLADKFRALGLNPDE